MRFLKDKPTGTIKKLRINSARAMKRVQSQHTKCRQKQLEALRDQRKGPARHP